MDYFEYNARKAQPKAEKPLDFVQPSNDEVTAARHAILANRTGIDVVEQELPDIDAPATVRDMWHNAR